MGEERSSPVVLTEAQNARHWNSLLSNSLHHSIFTLHGVRWWQQLTRLQQQTTISTITTNNMNTTTTTLTHTVVRLAKPCNQCGTTLHWWVSIAQKTFTGEYQLYTRHWQYRTVGLYCQSNASMQCLVFVNV